VWEDHITRSIVILTLKKGGNTMNKKRRKQIACVIEKLQHGASVLMKVQEEEQIAFDNLPEGIQYSGRGEKMEEAISTIEEAVSRVEDIIQNLEEL
jgi:hypothetical protein